MSQKTLTLLGFAAKAGKLSFGSRAALAAAQSGKARLIIVSGSVSPKSQKEITFFADKYNLPVRVLSEDMQTVSSAVGKACGVLSVNDRNFADSIFLQEETK